MLDELLDIVNEQDEVIGQKLRIDIFNEKCTNFRAVSAFIQNDRGQLWIPRRTEQKRFFPLCLDASMAGCVSSGESYLDAFERELMEELRIDLTCISYKEMGYLTPHQHEVAAFTRVFLLQSNDVPNFNTEDYVEFYWLFPHEIFLRLEQGDKSKSDLPKYIQSFFSKK